MRELIGGGLQTYLYHAHLIEVSVSVQNEFNGWHVHSSSVCALYTCSSSLSKGSPATMSCRLKPPKSHSLSSSSCPIGGGVPFVALWPFPEGDFKSSPLYNSFPKTSKGSGTFGGAAACLRFEPLGLRVDESKEVLESLETNDREDDLGLKGGLPPAGDGKR